MVRRNRRRNLLAIQVSTIGGVQISDFDAAVSDFQLGMPSGDRIVVEVKEAVA